MEFNRLISLVIGFIVLILVFVWIGSRFRSATITQNGTAVTVTVTPTTEEQNTGRNWNPFSFLFNRNNSPTPTSVSNVAQKNSPTPTAVIVNNDATVQQGSGDVVYKNNTTGETTTITKGGLTQIPETGASTLVLPLAFSALTLGAYLKKRV